MNPLVANRRPARPRAATSRAAARPPRHGVPPLPPVEPRGVAVRRMRRRLVRGTLGLSTLFVLMPLAAIAHELLVDLGAAQSWVRARRGGL